MRKRIESGGKGIQIECHLYQSLEVFNGIRKLKEKTLMGWKSLKVKLVGVNAMLMHNGDLANPLGKWSKALKTISSKKKKTDADFEEMAKVEFYGSLYYDEAAGPYLPSDMLEACMINGAKKDKQGPAAKAGLLVTKDAVLQYEGPRKIDELWKSENFRHTCGVRVGTSRIFRTRPKFDKWECVIEIEYEDSLCNQSDVLTWIRKAGSEVGVGDWRPRFGRFETELVK